MKTPPFRTLLIATYLLFSAGRVPAGEVWTETKYFIPDYQLTEKVPVPTAEWKVYQQKKILLGGEIEGIEYLDGFQKGTVSWLVRDTIVTILKNGETVVGAKTQGDSLNWASPADGALWTKNQKPFAVNREGSRKILVFDQGGLGGKPARRAWLSDESLKTLAEYSGKFITLYERQEGDVHVVAPENILAVIKKHRESQRKLSSVGAMPQ